MPRKKTFGTRYFGSLNTKVGPNNLDDTQLQICTNVRRDVAGELSPSQETSLVYSIPATDQGGGVGLGVLVRSGTVRISYATENYVYEDSAQLGASGGNVAHRFLGDGTRTYVLNGSESKVWDGTNYRDHGPLVKTIVAPPTDGFAYWTEAASTVLIYVSAVTKANPCGVTFTTDHNLIVGDRVTFANVGGTTQLNGNTYRVGTVPADDQITLTDLEGADIDGTSYGDWTSGGDAVPNPCGFAAAVKYYVSFLLVTPSGDTIESSLQQIPYSAKTGTSAPTYDAHTTTATNQVRIRLDTISVAEMAAYGAYVGGTAVLTPKIRIYRNKDGGAGPWLATELSGNDVFTAFSTALYTVDRSFGDSNMTVAWLDDIPGHDAPPACTMGVLCQQRMFLAGDTDYPSRLYYSLIGKYDYFPPTNYIECIDTITALGRFGEHVLIGTPAGIKLFSPVGTFGQLTDTQSPVGCEHPDSLCVTEFGTIFCRKDGAWLFDGVTAKKISEPIDSLWQAASGSWRGAYIAGHAYFTCGDDASARAFEFWKTEQGIEWSVAPFGIAGGASTQPYISVSGSPDDTYIYGMTADNYVGKLQGADTFHAMIAKTKALGNGVVRRWMRVRVDMDSTADVTAAVTTNRGQTTTVTIPASTAQRRYDLAASMLGEECDVTITGKPDALRSVVLETE